MSSLPDDGTYIIRNVGSGGRCLAVNQANNTIVLREYSPNDPSIRWILIDQIQRGGHDDVVTLQSAISTLGGHGFLIPQAARRGRPILYTPRAESTTLTHLNDDVYNIRFTRRTRFLVLDTSNNIVRLDNAATGVATQQWRFEPVPE